MQIPPQRGSELGAASGHGLICALLELGEVVRRFSAGGLQDGAGCLVADSLQLLQRAGCHPLGQFPLRKAGEHRSCTAECLDPVGRLTAAFEQEPDPPQCRDRIPSQFSAHDAILIRVKDAMCQ
jgi:hypothetical protein